MSLFIGLSALRSSQVGLDVISQNIANANTPGYHRQNVHLESLNDNLFRSQRIGSGVSVLELERVRFAVIESFLTETISDFENVDQTFATQRQIETFFLPGEGSLQASLESLFNEVSSLADSPSDVTTRRLAVQSGEQVANQFRELSANLADIQRGILNQVSNEIDLLNTEIEQLSQLNPEIVSATAIGGELPNGLLDRRDELINSIAEKIDISRVDSDDGSISLTFGSFSIQRNVTDISFTVAENDGEISLAFEGSGAEVQLTSGRIASLLESYNSTIPQYQEKLDELAVSLISNFDRVHSTGIGVSGSFSSLLGNRVISTPNRVLNEVSTNFPIQAGDVFISVIDPDGNRSTETISIDPATQSLNDIVTQLNSIANLSANVNPLSNELRIAATPGYEFDFTGTTETQPDLTNFTGSSVPEFSGTFNGSQNEQFSFEISGTGDVGISTGLSLLVRDSNGDLIETFNIGNGYEAGTPVDLGNGVTVTFPPGDVVAGDTFDSQFVATPDETGFLVALGLNSFFTGFDATSIGIDENVSEDAGRFATSFTGDSAESAKINEYIELADSQVLEGNRLSFNEFLVEITVGIGIDVQTSEQLTENLGTLLNQYRQEQASISGVDVNEEFVRLNQFQRSYEAAVRVIQTADAVIDELFTLIR